MKPQFLSVSLCQINSTVGDFEGNFKNIQNALNPLLPIGSKEKPHLIILPESCLTGYPIHDLVEIKPLFKKQDAYLNKIKKMIPAHTHLLLGAIVPNPKKPGRPYLNAALYIQNNSTRLIPKTLLPTWDIFNEERWFEPGNPKDNFLDISGFKIFVSICEDIWGWDHPQLSNIYAQNPLSKIKKPVHLVANLSASPYTRIKEIQRFTVVKLTSRHFKAPMAYCNRWGAEDELTFDGHSLVTDVKGNPIYRLKGFADDSFTFELNKKKQISSAQKLKTLKPIHANNIDTLKKSLVLGIQEFCHKNGFTKAHLGLSGGIDSAVVACLAAEALGPANVHTIALPTEFSTNESLNLATDFAKALGCSFEVTSIQSIYQEFKRTIDKAFHLTSFGVTHENLQARIRGALLMAYSNSQRSLLLATSNKSELATGYGTLYGDMCGGLMPIGDLYKTQVYELANLYAQKNWISSALIKRPPTAELRPNQKDQDTLPPYPILDKALESFIETGTHSTKDKKLQAFIQNQMFATEFKRWQSPPILKVSPRSFGKGRHWPLSH